MMIGLCSCSTDSTFSSHEIEEEGYVVLNVRVNKVAGYSEDNSFDQVIEEDLEGQINDLYLLAVPSEGTDGLQIYSLNSSVKSSYEQGQYRIIIPYGYYKFYIIANIDRFLAGNENGITLLDKGIETEGELQLLNLCFRKDEPLTADYLPMVCYPSEIMVNGVSSIDGIVAIDAGRSVKITAPLHFLCSKVRYTILFDAENSNMSEAFGDWRVEFAGLDNEPYVTNISASVPLMEVDNTTGQFLEDTYSEVAKWQLSLERYMYPGENQGGPDYPLSPSAVLQKWLEGLSWDSQRVWQGTVYLPENSNVEKTRLVFPYVVSNAKDITSSNTSEIMGMKSIDLFEEGIHFTGSSWSEAYVEDGAGSTGDFAGVLERGKMYDVVARVKNPDEFGIKNEAEDDPILSRSVFKTGDNLKIIWEPIYINSTSSNKYRYVKIIDETNLSYAEGYPYNGSPIYVYSEGHFVTERSNNSPSIEIIFCNTYNGNSGRDYLYPVTVYYDDIKRNYNSTDNCFEVFIDLNQD